MGIASVAERLDGVAEVELNPVTETGRAAVALPLEARDRVLVPVAPHSFQKGEEILGMPRDTIISFAGGWGFIRPDDNGEDLFIRQASSGLPAGWFPCAGDRLEYEVEAAPKGPKAVRAKPIFGDDDWRPLKVAWIEVGRIGFLQAPQGHVFVHPNSLNGIDPSELHAGVAVEALLVLTDRGVKAKAVRLSAAGFEEADFERGDADDEGGDD